MAHPNIINEHHQKNICVYCKKELKDQKWDSYWHGSMQEMHYKMIQCDCGKTNVIKVNFDGSGHDSWSKTLLEDAKPVLNIEAKINEIIKFKDQKRVDSFVK